MNVFLREIEKPAAQQMYAALDTVWPQREALMNSRLAQAGAPIRVVGMSSVWTVVYTQPGCYNWLFQHYLRLEGIALSWVGTGRIIFSLNYTDADFEELCVRFVRAWAQMQADGWFWTAPALTNKAIKRRVLGEMLAAKFR